ncbi:MAG: hypothetical protein ACR2MO_07385 [Acidimicrobiales bacterium]
MRAKMLAVLIAAIAVLGGCGGDTESTTLTDAASNEKSTTTDESSETTVSDAAAAVGAITSGRCAETAAAIAKSAAALPQALAGTDAEVGDAVDELEAFAKAAPSEIRSDLQLLTRGYADMIAILKDANFDPSSGAPPSPETIQKLQSAGEKLDGTEFQAASERVSAWFADKCGKS